MKDRCSWLGSIKEGPIYVLYAIGAGSILLQRRISLSQGASILKIARVYRHRSSSGPASSSWTSRLLVKIVRSDRPLESDCEI